MNDSICVPNSVNNKSHVPLQSTNPSSYLRIYSLIAKTNTNLNAINNHIHLISIMNTYHQTGATSSGPSMHFSKFFWKLNATYSQYFSRITSCLVRISLHSSRTFSESATRSSFERTSSAAGDSGCRKQRSSYRSMRKERRCGEVQPCVW